MQRIFIGPKQITVKNSDFFDASITLFGNNTNNNTSYQKQVTFDFWDPDNTPLEIDIYNYEIAKLTQPSVLMAHNPKILSQCIFPNNVRQICKNSKSILEVLDNKIETRCIMKNIVPMLNYYTVKGKDFSYNQLKNISNHLVVQLPFGSGGSKTYLCSEENSEQIKLMLIPNEIYVISAYQHANVPYNIHCLIGNEQIELLAPSQQILEISDKIEYSGPKFGITIPNDTKSKLIDYSVRVCKKIQTMGYYGVLGIDYIYTNNELYFIEINPRFQGSTHIVDGLLKKSGLPSIFDYNYRAFEGKEMPSTKEMELSLSKK